MKKELVKQMVERSLNYFQGKVVLIDFNGTISTLYQYENFQWEISEREISFFSPIEEQVTSIQLDKINYIDTECGLEEPTELFNAIEIYLDDMAIRLWTE